MVASDGNVNKKRSVNVIRCVIYVPSGTDELSEDVIMSSYGVELLSEPELRSCIPPLLDTLNVSDAVKQCIRSKNTKSIKANAQNKKYNNPRTHF